MLRTSREIGLTCREISRTEYTFSRNTLFLGNAINFNGNERDRDLLSSMMPPFISVFYPRANKLGFFLPRKNLTPRKAFSMLNERV